MCFWEAWRNVVHKLPSGVRVTYLGSTLEILVVLSSPAPWRHIRLICESKTYFCFCSCCYSLMIAHWWSPAAQICTGWKKAQYEASGVYFILGGSYSEVYSECFNSCSCRFFFFYLTKEMTSDKLQCCDSAAPSKQELLCLKDQLRQTAACLGNGAISNEQWEAESQPTPWLARQNFRSPCP